MKVIMCMLLALAGGIPGPEVIESGMREAQLRYQDNDPAGALEGLLELMPAVQAHGDDHRYRWAIGRCLEALGRFDEAIDAYAMAARLAPDADGRARAEAAIGAIRGRDRATLAAAIAPAPEPTPTMPAPEPSVEATAPEPDNPDSRVTAAVDAGDPSVGGGWTLGVGVGYGRAALLGQAPGWTFSGGDEVSIAGALTRDMAGWDVALELGMARQTHDLRYRDVVRYDVTLHSLYLRAFADVDLLPGTATGLLVGGGPGLAIVLGGDARGSVGPPSDDTGFDTLQPLAALRVGLWLWRAQGIRLDARAELGLLPVGAGEGRIARGGLVASWHH